MHLHWAEPRAGSDLLSRVLPLLGTAISRMESTTLRYASPLLFTSFVVMFILWRLQRREWERAREELKQATGRQLQLEQERDQAQEELFRRLYEESELNKEKFRFQA